MSCPCSTNPELLLGFKCNLLKWQLFQLRLINVDFGEKIKKSPGRKEGSRIELHYKMLPLKLVQ